MNVYKKSYLVFTLPWCVLSFEISAIKIYHYLVFARFNSCEKLFFFKITVDLTTAAFSTTKTTQLNQKKTCKDYTDCRCVWVDLQRLIGLKQLNKSYNILPQPHWCCECLLIEKKWAKETDH